MKQNLLTLALLLCTCLQTWADTWTDSNGISWTYTVSDGYAMDLRPTNKSSINLDYLKIPSPVNGYIVKSIAKEAFYGRLMKSVTIPKGVTSIGDHAFAYCCLLSVTIPESVTSIGQGAFNGCDLTKVKVPVIDKAAFCNNQVIELIRWKLDTPVKLIDGEGYEITEYIIPEGVENIGANAFYNCSGLTSVTIPESVTSIGREAFSGCSGLTSINIPESVTSIGDYAFYNCSSLTSVTINNNTIMSCYLIGSIFDVQVKNYIIGESVTSIGDYAFVECSGLTSVTIPSSVTSIGEGAFDSCSGLKIVIIPESVTSIGEFTFYECSGLTGINIPESVTSIGESAFGECSGLKNVTIPESVKSIGDNAFCGCTGLKSVTIPSSVTSIGWEAFSGCSGLTSVYCYLPTPLTIGSKTFTNRAHALLYVPYGCKTAYQDADYWKEFKYIIEMDKPSGIENIDVDTDFDNDIEVYDLNGLRQPTMHRGVNIIKMSDGTIKKVMVK